MARLPCAWAEGADDQYVRIYNMIQEADGLDGNGAWSQALEKYSEAQKQLQQFQKGYPEWNPKVVGFRLNYVAGRITEIAPKVPAAPAAPVVSSPATPQNVVPSPASNKSTVARPSSLAPRPSDAEMQLNALREETRQLQTEKALLEAKLKEALSVQPANADPRELERALEQVKSLQKESELLKTALVKEKSKAKPAMVDTNALAEARHALATANLQLTEQTQKADQLAKEKQFLQDKLSLLTPTPENATAFETTKKALEEANKKVDQHKALVEKLATEGETLQFRVKELTQQNEAAAAANARNAAALEEGKKALDEANRQVAEQTKKAEALARELAHAKMSQPAVGTKDGSALESTRKDLEQANRQLAQQKEVSSKLAADRDALESRIKAMGSTEEAAAALRAENAALKKEVADLKVAAPSVVGGSDVGPQLAEAQSRITALESNQDILRIERIALENHVQRLYATIEANSAVVAGPAGAKPGDAARIRELERERDELDAKLTMAVKESDSRKSEGAKRIAALEDEMASLRSRIELLEGRRVPFSAQELALLSKSDPKTAAPDAQIRNWLKDLPPAALALVTDAQRAAAAGQVQEAQEKYARALAMAPTNVFTLANLAAVQLQCNRLPEAERNAGQAVALGTNDAYSLTILGYIKYRQEKYDDALDALGRAAKADPQNAQVQNYLGIVLSQKGQRNGAEAAFRRAVEFDPRYADAHHNLAVFYVSQQPPSVDLARWHYQRAVSAGQPKDQELEGLFEARK